MLRALTALRFPAALAVFLSHAPLTRPEALAFSSGYSGVGFFFLLSGFILTYNYRGGIDLRRYFSARFARIYPVHVCGMVLALAVLAAYGGGPEWNNAAIGERTVASALQAVLMQSWFPSAHIHFSGNGPAWSLSDEAFFYACFPFALAGVAAAFRRHGAGALLVAAAAVWTLLAAVLANVHAQFDDWTLYVFPPVRFIDFFVGMLLGAAFLRSNRPSSWRVDPTLIETAALCALALGVAVTAFAPQSLQFSAAMMPFSATLIFVFARQRGAISRALSTAPLVRLGEASYAFYLLHRPVVRIVEAGLHLSGWPGFALSLAVSIAVSLAVFAYVETPLRHVIRERLGRGSTSLTSEKRMYAAGLCADAAGQPSRHHAART